MPIWSNMTLFSCLLNWVLANTFSNSICVHFGVENFPPLYSSFHSLEEQYLPASLFLAVHISDTFALCFTGTAEVLTLTWESCMSLYGSRKLVVCENWQLTYHTVPLVFLFVSVQLFPCLDLALVFDFYMFPMRWIFCLRNSCTNAFV